MSYSHRLSERPLDSLVNVEYSNLRLPISGPALMDRSPFWRIVRQNQHLVVFTNTARADCPTAPWTVHGYLNNTYMFTLWHIHMLYAPSTISSYLIIPIYKHDIPTRASYLFIAPCTHIKVEPHPKPLSSYALSSISHRLLSVLHTWNLMQHMHNIQVHDVGAMPSNDPSYWKYPHPPSRHLSLLTLFLVA